jgi:uncharacterized membrane protein YsdA (DUF1294 family)
VGVTAAHRPRLWWSCSALGLAVVVAWALALLPRVTWPWAWLGSISLVTLAGYAHDKIAAVRGWRRIPELTLHLLALLGGTPGALVGMRLFRHKTLKGRFRLVLLGILVLQVAAALLLQHRLHS